MFVITGFIPVLRGQVVVWSNPGFEVTVVITNSGPYNVGETTPSSPATGNTNMSLGSYTLDFDLNVRGVSLDSLGGFVGGIFGLYGANSGQFYGQGLQTNVPVSFFPAAGTGYQHVSLSLGNFGTAGAALLNPTNTSFSFFMGVYMSGLTYIGTETITVTNITITMNTNVLAPIVPTLRILPAKPGLRVFAQNSAATYNQEGFGTVDLNESWAGQATPTHPVSYAITFADFDTVNNFTFYAQFAQGAPPGDPFGVYNAQNALVWNITANSSGFTTAINWKTNAPQSGTISNALSLMTTSANGRGTWTLTFTNDTDGTVTCPDGTSGSFSLDSNITTNFANPLIIDFGIAPNSPAGYGQFIDISRIVISNVLDGTEIDDCTQDASLNTNLWDPAFSIDGGSVIQVSTNTPYWITWTLPDAGYGLATKADLSNTNVPWSSLNYYGSGAGITPTGPTQMGLSNKWVLIPKACLPTVDGTKNGPVSPTGFFRLSNPPPSQ